jgi:acyl-coenzyme A thioesterase PaaI-like protein
MSGKNLPAQVKKGGRTVALLECEIRDGKDSLVAFATSTCMVLRGDIAKGR